MSSFTACYSKPQHWVAQKRELKLPVSELGLSFSHGNSSSLVVKATLMALKGSPAVQLPSLVVSVGVIPDTLWQAAHAGQMCTLAPLF